MPSLETIESGQRSAADADRRGAAAPAPRRAATEAGAPGREADDLESALFLGRRLIGAAESFAAAFASGNLGDIELPPDVGSAADQAAVRAAAPLYLASELEAAGLLPAAELLAGLFASGSLGLLGGPAVDQLAAFWRGRHERFTPAERRGFFVRLFGADFGAGLTGEEGPNRAFATHLTELAEAIQVWEGHPLWPPSTGPREETRVRLSAHQLAANLAPRSGGMAAFAAGDILATLQAALDIFKEPEVQAAFAARSVWEATRNLFRRYRGHAPETSRHLTRAKSGQLILAWLADVLPQLHNYSVPVLTPGHEAIAASAAWLQAGLAPTHHRSPISALASEVETNSDEGEALIYEGVIEHADHPNFPFKLPAPAKGKDAHRFTVAADRKFSRWEIQSIEVTPGAGYEVVNQPEPGASGGQTIQIAWWHPPFGKIRARLSVYVSSSGLSSAPKVLYDAPGWLDQCRDHLQQGIPFGIAVRGEAARQIHSALEKAGQQQPGPLAARPFIAGVDDAIILAVIGAVVLVVIAAMGFFVLYNIIQTAMQKGYDIQDTRFRIGGGEGPLRQDHELVFNLRPPQNG